MSRQQDSSGLLIPLALVAGAGTLAAAAALLAGASKGRNAPVSAPILIPAPPKAMEWLGGPSRRNIDALAFLFASENENASLLVWTLQALAANNFARQLARSHKQITNIGDMLQSGIDKRIGNRLYDLGWGPQVDKLKKITRWGGTSAGQRPLAVNWLKFEMAERLLLNRIDLGELRGKRGEPMPSSDEWYHINSFLQYEGFRETVIRQAGPGAETDAAVIVAQWGKPRLVAAVEGLHFYATGGR